MAGMSEEQVGARLTVLGSAEFVRNLAAGAKALQDYAKAADEAAAASARASDGLKASGAVAADAAVTQSVAAGETAAAADKQLLLGDAAVVSSGGLKSATADVKAHSAAVKEMAGTVAKWGSLVATGALYEGIKNQMAFQQQMQQSALDAGLKASQIPGLSKGVLGLSSQYGISATSMSQGLYRIASAAPGLHQTNAELLTLLKSAAQLTTIFGNTGNMDSVSRMYGAINSTKIGLTEHAKGVMTPLQINEWAKAVAGHGDMYGGDLVAALGTGVLTGSKAYGYSLNDFGAWLDTLSPAMNASKAASLINHGMGMLSGPTAQAGEMMSLMGSSVLGYNRAKSKGGLLGQIQLIHQMLTRPLTGKNFYSKFYGEGMGSETGGTGGTPTGGTALLRAMQFSPADITQAIKGGMASVPGMEQAVLVKMFGGAKGATPILNLVNNPGILKNKYAAIQAQENPASYNASLKLAMKEPITQWHIFEQTLKNITITLGQDVMPTFDSFLHMIEGAGKFLSKEGWARDALIYGGAGVFGASLAVKGYTDVTKVFRGVTSIGSKIFGVGGSTAGLDTAGVTMNTAADKMLIAADRMGVGGGGIPGGPRDPVTGAPVPVSPGSDVPKTIIPAMPGTYVNGVRAVDDIPGALGPGMAKALGVAGLGYLVYRVARDPKAFNRGQYNWWDNNFNKDLANSGIHIASPAPFNTAATSMGQAYQRARTAGYPTGMVNNLPNVQAVAQTQSITSILDPLGRASSSLSRAATASQDLMKTSASDLTKSATDVSKGGTDVSKAGTALSTSASAQHAAASALSSAATDLSNAAAHLASEQLNIGAITAALRNKTARS